MNQEWPVKKTDNNINDWAKKISEISPELSRQLNEDRNIGYENLEKLNLPRYKKNKLPLSDFLKNPEAAVADLESDRFFVSIIPKEKKFERFSKSGADLSQILDFIRDKIESYDQDKYEIVVNQYFDNLYGGSMIIGENGEVHVEFKEGEQTDIAKGKIIPEFFVSRDKFTNSLKYSFSNEELRKIIFGTLLTVPHSGEDRELKFERGYYEFVIVKRDEKSNPEPIFLDYRSNTAYDLGWKMKFDAREQKNELEK